jgi:hypothetical protein
MNVSYKFKLTHGHLNDITDPIKLGHFDARTMAYILSQRYKNLNVQNWRDQSRNTTYHNIKKINSTMILPVTMIYLFINCRKFNHFT